MAGKPVEHAAFVLNPFEDLLVFDRTTVSHGGTSSLRSKEVYVFCDCCVYDLHFALKGIFFNCW